MTIDDAVYLQKVFYPSRSNASGFTSGVTTMTAVEDDDVRLGGRLHIHPSSEVLILGFHGNGERADHYDDLAADFVACGASFWMVDYRGYGLSTGRPTITSLYGDAQAFLEQMPRSLGATSTERPIRKVIAWGRSLGSGPACELAAYHPDRVHALFLDSPFADGRNLLRRKLGGQSIPDTPATAILDNRERIRRVHQPVRILHGREDRQIPTSDAQELINLCPSASKQLHIIPFADHNSLLTHGLETYFETLRQLVSAV